ncbi:MAG: hemerythrin [Candidatus Competibacteraceae bacterium]|nr:hemerythrin [Candidatus Competibacteraceae bacterium]
MSKFVECLTSFSGGIEEIDAEHQILVDLLDLRVHEAIQRRRSGSLPGTLLGGWMSHQLHFAVEESLMPSPLTGIQAAQERHDKLEGSAELRNKMSAGKVRSAYDLAQFLSRCG